MDPQFEELAQRLKRELTTVVADQFAAAEIRLVGQYKIHAEEMKAEVERAAEGYGATLEAINRKLQELETKWDTANHRPRERTLGRNADHADRGH